MLQNIVRDLLWKEVARKKRALLFFWSKARKAAAHVFARLEGKIVKVKNYEGLQSASHPAQRSKFY